MWLSNNSTHLLEILFIVVGTPATQSNKYKMYQILLYFMTLLLQVNLIWQHSANAWQTLFVDIRILTGRDGPKLLVESDHHQAGQSIFMVSSSSRIRVDDNGYLTMALCHCPIFFLYFIISKISVIVFYDPKKCNVGQSDWLC